MVWFAFAALAVTAAAVTALLVPRIRIDDPESPDFSQLGGWRSAACAAALAVVAAQVLWVLPVQAWWLWLPYLGLGAPLALVDLRTTFLPKALHWPAAVAMGIGALALATTDRGAALSAVIGAAAAGGFLYLAYRASDSLGFGDVRLALLVGAVAGQSGPMAWALALFVGTALGAIHGIVHALRRRRDPEVPGHYPYGPALWLGPVVGAALGAIGW